MRAGKRHDRLKQFTAAPGEDILVMKNIVKEYHMGGETSTVLKGIDFSVKKENL